MSDLKRRPSIPQKLVSFEDTARGHAQLAKELAGGWSIAQILKYKNGFICALEKYEGTRSLAQILSAPLYNKKKQIPIES